MMLLTNLKLAIRNVLRNKRRTLITLSSIAIGGATLILVGGYIEYTYWGLREMTIRSELGHIQIYKEGFLQSGNIEPSNYLFDPQDEVKIQNVLNVMPEIKHYSKRLSLSGIISNGNKSLFFMGQGIEPDKESEISTSMTMVEGTDLFGEDKYKVLVGKELALQLNLKPGKTVTLLTTTLYGGMNAIDFQVAGIISNGVKAFDEKIIRMPLKDAQELLGTTGFERYVLLLNQTKNTDIVYTLLINQSKKLNIELLKWENLADYYSKVKVVYANIFMFLKTVILLIIVLSIINTMTMSVMERVPEIGTIRALGTHRKEVLMMMLSEGLVLGVWGGLIAIVIGCAVSFFINMLGGIYMPPPPGHTQGYMILIKIVPNVLLFTFCLSVVAAILSSIFPALKGSRLNITQAIRHV